MQPLFPLHSAILHTLGYCISAQHQPTLGCALSPPSNNNLLLSCRLPWCSLLTLVSRSSLSLVLYLSFFNRFSTSARFSTLTKWRFRIFSFLTLRICSASSLPTLVALSDMRSTLTLLCPLYTLLFCIFHLLLHFYHITVMWLELSLYLLLVFLVSKFFFSFFLCSCDLWLTIITLPVQ